MGGKVFKNTIPIKRELFPKIYQELNEKLNLYNSKVVGSFMIKPESGDMDIALWNREFPDLTKLDSDFEFRKVGANLHLNYQFENNFYQIDFFKCGSEEMADFFYKSKSLNSKYSAEYRNLLLFDFFRELNPIHDDEKFIINSFGLFEVILNYKGLEVSRLMISNNPHFILDKYCGGLEIEDFEDFETLLNKIQEKKMWMNSLKKRYLETLKRIKKEIPIEICNFKENQ